MENVEIIILQVDRWLEYKKLKLESLTLEPTAFANTPEEKEKDSDQDWQKDLEDFLESKNQFAYFAEINGKLIGMAAAYRESHLKSSHIAVIFGVYLSKEFRCKGIAKKLLQKLLAELENRGDIVKLNLDVTTTQLAAVNLYKSLGFNIVGELKKEYLVNGKFYDVYEMEKYLK